MLSCLSGTRHAFLNDWMSTWSSWLSFRVHLCSGCVLTFSFFMHCILSGPSDRWLDQTHNFGFISTTLESFKKHWVWQTEGEREGEDEEEEEGEERRPEHVHLRRAFIVLLFIFFTQPYVVVTWKPLCVVQSMVIPHLRSQCARAWHSPSMISNRVNFFYL